MLPIVDYIHTSGKHYEATFYSCLPIERQEFVKDSINRAMKFENNRFQCKNVDGNITQCFYVKSRNVLIIRVKDITKTRIIQSLAILLDKLHIPSRRREYSTWEQ